MRTGISVDESLTIALLQALLMDQQADGDAEGATRTRRVIARQIELQRRKEQAVLAGRWPFKQSKPEEGDDHGESGEKSGP